MALRLFNQIHSKLFRHYKTPPLAPSIKEKNFSDTAAIQEGEEQIDLLSEDGTKNQKDKKLNITRNSLEYFSSGTKTSPMSVIKPIQPYTLSPMLNQTRSFSAPSSDECKVKKSQDSQCKKFKLCNCEQPTSTICKVTVQPAKCKKKEAPYPSFSEACYEEPYNKPSECKLCPWKSEDNPSFKGPIVTTFRKLHTGRSWLSNNIVDTEGNEIAKKCATFSPLPVGDNAVHLLSSGRLYLLSEAEEVSSEKPCKKFPFKVFKYEIGSKIKEEIDDGCEKKTCVKKKRKLIKDCPPDKEKICRQSANDGIFIGDALNESILSIIMKEKKDKKDNCDTNKHQTCEVEEDCRKPECPPKPGKTLNCPSESLIRPPGYKRKPKKNQKKASPVEEGAKEIEELRLIPNPIYNGGVIYNNNLRPTIPQSG